MPLSTGLYYMGQNVATETNWIDQLLNPRLTVVLNGQDLELILRMPNAKAIDDLEKLSIPIGMMSGKLADLQAADAPDHQALLEVSADYGKAQRGVLKEWALNCVQGVGNLPIGVGKKKEREIIERALSIPFIVNAVCEKAKEAGYVPGPLCLSFVPVLGRQVATPDATTPEDDAGTDSHQPEAPEAK